MQLENLSLKIKELEESHAAKYISKIISEILDEWHIQINSVVTVITDNLQTLPTFKKRYGIRLDVKNIYHIYVLFTL